MPRAIAQYKSYDVIVWWETRVEIASALARLVRMRRSPGVTLFESV